MGAPHTRRCGSPMGSQYMRLALPTHGYYINISRWVPDGIGNKHICIPMGYPYAYIGYFTVLVSKSDYFHGAHCQKQPIGNT